MTIRFMSPPDQQPELILKLPEQPVIVEADAVRLAQVASNLLSNACKYTGPHGKIQVTAGVEGQAPYLRCRIMGRASRPS